MILKYLEFITEARGDVKLPTIMSESFIRRCKSIDSPISKAIINMDRKPSSFCFLDDNLNGESIDYSESERVLHVLNKMYAHVDAQNYLSKMSNPDPDSPFWQSNRVGIKVGRFVKKFLGDNFTDAQIQDFVNKWKSSFKVKGEKFDFTTGYGIIEAYNTKNYAGEEGYNPLWNSCMNDRLDLVEFYLYVKDLEMVLLLDSANKILARALLWTDTEGRKFLDRVYYSFDKDYFKFISLAKESGWYYKSKNISGGATWILNGVEHNIKAKIKFPKDAISQLEDEYSGYPKFPYLDSFYYLSEEGFLMNYEPSGSYFKLNCTDGDYEYYSGLYDVRGNSIENEDDYIFSKTQGGLISLYNSEHVEYDGFDDYVELRYLVDPKNGFIQDPDTLQWYRKEDYKIKSKN